MHDLIAVRSVTGRPLVGEGIRSSESAECVWGTRLSDCEGTCRIYRVESRSPYPVRIATDVRGCTVALRGTLREAAKLRRRYGIDATEPARLVAELWRRDGSSALAALEGPISGVIWDDRRASICAFRDKRGQLPLLYYRNGESMAFATNPALLVRGIARDVAVNSSRVAATMMHSSDFARDYYYEDIYRVRPRECLIWNLAAGRRAFRDYWPNGGCGAEEVEVSTRLRRGLTRAIARLPLGDRATALSGGLDSAVLASIDRRLRDREEESSRTARMQYLGGRPTELVERVSGEHLSFHVPDHADPSQWEGEQFPVEWGPMSVMGEPIFRQFYREFASRLDRRMVLHGLGADFLFSVSRHWLLDWCLRPPPNRAKFGALSREFTGADDWEAPARALLRRAPPGIRQIVQKMRQRVRAEHREKVPWRFGRRWVRPVDRWRGVFPGDVLGSSADYPSSPAALGLLRYQSWRQELNLLRFQKLARFSGVTFSFPWLDSAIGEYAVGLRPDQLRSGGTDKLPVRRLARSLLPEVWSSNSNFGERGIGEVGAALFEAYRDRVEAWMRNSRLGRLGLIDEAAFLRAYRAVSEVPCETLAARDFQSPLWYTIACEQWLRRVEATSNR